MEGLEVMTKNNALIVLALPVWVSLFIAAMMAYGLHQPNVSPEMVRSDLIIWVVFCLLPVITCVVYVIRSTREKTSSALSQAA